MSKMKSTGKNQFYRGLLVLGFLIFSFSASAHHSAAMFDLEKEIQVEGIVKKFQFTNPHVWIHLIVTDENGNEKVWKVEALNPNALKRKGWKRNSFVAGDKVSVTFYPAKSGDPKGYFIRATTADGTQLGQVFTDRIR